MKGRPGAAAKATGVLNRRLGILHGKSLMDCTTKRFISEWPRSAEADFEVPGESIWFDGHFPGKPVLPGVAQLAFVMDVLEQTLGKTVSVAGVSRVRFKQAIHPGDPITVHVTPAETGSRKYGFRIFSRTELACTGTMEIESPSR